MPQYLMFMTQDHWVSWFIVNAGIPSDDLHILATVVYANAITNQCIDT